MAEMTKKTGNKWLQRIDDAQRFRKEKLTNNVTRLLELYKGNHWGNIGLTRRKDLITVNLIFPTIRNQIGYYYYRDPKMYVKAENEESELTAPLAEHYLNYWWRETNVRLQQRFKIYDVLIFGHAVSEIGWRFETDVVKKKGKDERIAYYEYIKKDQPYVKRISPLRFLTDSRAEMNPVSESEFVAKEFFRAEEDVKADPRYKNTKDLDAANTTTDREKDRYGEEVTKLVEIHDRKNMKLIVMAEGYDQPLLEEDHPYEDVLEGHNFEWLQFNHVPDKQFGISPISLIEDQQYELNRTRTQMFNHRRRISNRRYIYDEGAIRDREIAKLEDSEGGAMVPVGNIDRIKPLDDARLSFDVPLIESVIKQDIRELTGLPASQYGVVDNKPRSATEVSMVGSAMMNRTDDNLILVEEDTRNTARKMLQCIQAFMDKEKAIKIIGPKGAFWHKGSKDDIQGEYGTVIDPGSTTKDSEPIRRKQAVDLLNILAQIPGINRRRLVTDTLNAFEAQRTEEYFLDNFDQVNGAPPPQAPGGPVDGQNLQSGTPDPSRIATDANQTGPLSSSGG